MSDTVASFSKALQSTDYHYSIVFHTNYCTLFTCYIVRWYASVSTVSYQLVLCTKKSLVPIVGVERLAWYLSHLISPDAISMHVCYPPTYYVPVRAHANFRELMNKFDQLEREIVRYVDKLNFSDANVKMFKIDLVKTKAADVEWVPTTNRSAGRVNRNSPYYINKINVEVVYEDQCEQS